MAKTLKRWARSCNELSAWVVEANLAPTWPRQPGNLAKKPTWPNLAMSNQATSQNRDIIPISNLVKQPTWQPGESFNLTTWQIIQPDIKILVLKVKLAMSVIIHKSVGTQCVV